MVKTTSVTVYNETEQKKKNIQTLNGPYKINNHHFIYPSYSSFSSKKDFIMVYM